MIHVALINHSTVVDDATIQPLAEALTEQAVHLGTAGYDVLADVHVATPADVGSHAWQLLVVDNTDQANALGYHTTTPAGLPVAYIFAETAKSAGLSWTVTASHEFIEMIVDPEAQLGIDLGRGTWLAWEACDPCEADRYGYLIGSVLVSDFVTPAWFDRRGVAPYDWTNNVHKPLALLPGGYIAVQRHGHWNQITAREESPDGISRVQFAQRIERRKARGALSLST